MVKYLEKEYPFKSHFLELPEFLKYHYIDEGEGEVLLMLHGNPTWSFFYRNLIKKFKNTHRVIVPDHIGCGFSDKPQDYEYRLENHISNVEKLIEHLKLKNITLIVHDWGGAIGFGMATNNIENIKKIIILNTAAFRSSYIAPSINFCRIPFLGEAIIRHFNAFAWPATFMAVTKKLSSDVKKGFLHPYNNYKNRIATAKFVTDIPMKENHPSYQTLVNIEEKLDEINCPILILWGKKDFCFNDYFLEKWQKIYPQAQVKVYCDGGHYLLEDETQSVIDEVENFL